MHLPSVCKSYTANARDHDFYHAVPICLQFNEMLTCTTDDYKDEFDFDIQSVKPAQSQPDTHKPLVSSSDNEKLKII